MRTESASVDSFRLAEAIRESRQLQAEGQHLLEYSLRLIFEMRDGKRKTSEAWARFLREQGSQLPS